MSHVPPPLGHGKRRYWSSWLLMSLTSSPNFNARPAEASVPTRATQNPVRVRDGPSPPPAGSDVPPSVALADPSGRGTSTETGDRVRLRGRLWPDASVNSCLVVV